MSKPIDTCWPLQKWTSHTELWQKSVTYVWLGDCISQLVRNRPSFAWRNPEWRWWGVEAPKNTNSTIATIARIWPALFSFPPGQDLLFFLPLDPPSSLIFMWCHLICFSASSSSIFPPTWNPPQIGVFSDIAATCKKTSALSAEPANFHLLLLYSCSTNNIEVNTIHRIPSATASKQKMLWFSMVGSS